PVSMRGRVVDDQGQPIAGAKIGTSLGLVDQDVDEPWRYINSHEKLPETDANGRFEIANVKPASRIAVYINKAGYAGVWSPRVTAEKSKDVELGDLVLKKATRELTGRVVNPSDQPIAGARVAVQDFCGDVETVTGPDGRFRLHAVPETNGRL